ncbi:MAG: glucose-6-phosphate isomerase [Candidatus Omnitrophota bacterium]
MKLNTKYLNRFILKKEFKFIEEEIKDAHHMLENGTGLGSDFHGWLHLPSTTTRKSLASINAAAKTIRDISDVFIVVGIGGSYLGSRAAIEFLSPVKEKSKIDICFAGNSIDPDYLNKLLTDVKDKRIVINVISKSGTTTEPAVAFRIIKSLLRKKYTSSELKKRIIFTTTKGKGLLSEEAKKDGYRCFYIPENVGGRFSVLTAVGLLPMAAAGVDIDELMKGAANVESESSSYKIERNLAYYYAALRNLLYRNGKKIEIMCSFHTRLFYFLEWWKQLFAESEGKEGKGLFPAISIFSTDLHAIGQLIQEGERNIFETFLKIDKKASDVKLPHDKYNIDNLNYLSGKGLDFINKMAYRGTALAHAEGNVPNMTLSVDECSAFCLGELIYFFQRAVGISGYLLGINPFDQPGVEAYKKNMFKLLGKPRTSSIKKFRG